MAHHKPTPDDPEAAKLAGNGARQEKIEPGFDPDATYLPEFSAKAEAGLPRMAVPGPEEKDTDLAEEPFDPDATALHRAAPGRSPTAIDFPLDFAPAPVSGPDPEGAGLQSAAPLRDAGTEIDFPLDFPEAEPGTASLHPAAPGRDSGAEVDVPLDFPLEFPASEPAVEASASHQAAPGHDSRAVDLPLDFPLDFPDSAAEAGASALHRPVPAVDGGSNIDFPLDFPDADATRLGRTGPDSAAAWLNRFEPDGDATQLHRTQRDNGANDPPRAEADAEATQLHRPQRPAEAEGTPLHRFQKEPDATPLERPGPDAEATQLHRPQRPVETAGTPLHRFLHKEEPDVTPPQPSEADADATQLHRPLFPAGAQVAPFNRLQPEPDATPLPRPEPGAEATRLHRLEPQADAEATQLHRPQRAADPEAPQSQRPGPEPDAEATRLQRPQPDPEATQLHKPTRKGDEESKPQRRPMPAFLEADPEATAYIPTPGRRRPAAAQPAVPVPAPAARASDPNEAYLEGLVGLNPLVGAANRVLSIVPQLRSTLRHPDPAGLREDLLERIEAFKQSAAGKGCAAEAIAAARYALCALVDDSVRHTPWAGGVLWEQRGLLQTLQGEPSGSNGDQFFKLLTDAEEAPAANIDLLEFFAVCLSLGYEGRFRTASGGRVQLEQVWVRLNGLIKQERGGATGELSIRWRGLEAPMRRRSPWFVTWVSASVCAGLLVSVYLGLRILLATGSEPAASALAALRAKVPPVAQEGAQPPAGRLKTYLAREIESGQLMLTEDGAKSVVTLSGDELFPSGSDMLDARYLPTVLRVAQALNKVPGTITIAGHTDDHPVRSARFPSNWELSRERALTVMKFMSGELADPGRIGTEGLADSEPVAANDSPANRARNRRITAVLRVAP